MITTPTTLILGAGASQPYGFPSGRALSNQVLNQLSSGAVRNALNRQNYDQDRIARFVDRLRRSKLASIDAFLESADEFDRDVGRLAIAGVIMSAEKRNSLLGADAQLDWYAYLWNLMRRGCDAHSFGRNRVFIVTFNYDRSFEEYFTDVIGAAFDLPTEKAAEVFRQGVRMVHVHGSLGDVPFGAVQAHNFSMLHRAAREIRIVSDPIASHDSRFDEARELIRESARVGIIGFGFHPENVARLQFSHSLSVSTRNEQAFVACTYGMGRAEIHRAQLAVGVAMGVGTPSMDALQFLREIPFIG